MVVFIQSNKATLGSRSEDSPVNWKSIEPHCIFELIIMATSQRPCTHCFRGTLLGTGGMVPAQPVFLTDFGGIENRSCKASSITCLCGGIKLTLV